MRVVYVGPGDGVTLAPVTGGTWCPQGEPVEVPAAVGRSLCQQGTFVEAKPKRASSAGD